MKTLFEIDYKNSTFKLWTAIFFGFFTLYTLMSWVPSIAKDTGLPFDMATYVGIALNVGAAIGTASVGLLASKFGLKKTVFTFLLCAFMVMLVYGNITLTTALIFAMVFLIGVFVQGGFNGMYPILSRVYPTEIRTTGVGFAVGIGRFGAILGPALFGILSDSGISIPTLFSLFSVPLLITALCVWGLKSKNLN
jgi:AAHS family 4-hydroxybenzoate transporter-like MFS transporter